MPCLETAPFGAIFSDHYHTHPGTQRRKKRSAYIQPREGGMEGWRAPTASSTQTGIDAPRYLGRMYRASMRRNFFLRAPPSQQKDG